MFHGGSAGARSVPWSVVHMNDVDVQTGVSGGRLYRGGREEITLLLSVNHSGCVEQPRDTRSTPVAWVLLL